tara:strand:+ start:328 stop:486 length:159 start_codon:yes stop_codon:yes gene_type:complete
MLDDFGLDLYVAAKNSERWLGRESSLSACRLIFLFKEAEWCFYIGSLYVDEK